MHLSHPDMSQVCDFFWWLGCLVNGLLWVVFFVGCGEVFLGVFFGYSTRKLSSVVSSFA